VSTHDVLAKKSEEGALLCCETRAESESNNQPGSLVRHCLLINYLM
jgi:hypothetical protein